jgi:hypothetical protein
LTCACLYASNAASCCLAYRCAYDATSCSKVSRRLAASSSEMFQTLARCSADLNMYFRSAHQARSTSLALWLCDLCLCKLWLRALVVVRLHTGGCGCASAVAVGCAA